MSKAEFPGWLKEIIFLDRRRYVVFPDNRTDMAH